MIVSAVLERFPCTFRAIALDFWVLGHFQSSFHAFCEAFAANFIVSAVSEQFQSSLPAVFEAFAANFIVSAVSERFQNSSRALALDFWLLGHFRAILEQFPSGFEEFTSNFIVNGFSER